MIDTRLIVDSVAASPRARAREQRDRDDEHPRRLRRRRTRPCASSSSSPRPTTTAASATTPPSSPRTMRRPHPPRTPIEKDIVEAERAVAAFARAQPRRDGDRAALRQRPRARTCDTSHTALLSLPGGAVDPRLRPALPVHRTRTTSPACSSTRRARPARASTTPPATACSCSRRSRRCSASRSRRCCRRGARARGGRAAPRRRADPARDAPAAALRPRARQPQAQGRGLRVPRHDARDGAGVRRAPAHARAARRPRARATSTSARSRSSCAGARPCAATTGSAWAPRARSARGAGARAGVAARCAPGRAWRRAARRSDRDGTLRTGSPSSSGGAAAPEPAAEP